MKASVSKPKSPRSEFARSAVAVAVGAALAYGGAQLFARLNPLQPQAAPTTIKIEPATLPKVTPVEPVAPGEDPWWRGDAEFWQEQARLNSAAVAPQYRELQFAWSERMAALAKQRAQQDGSKRDPATLQAKDAQTTELHIQPRTKP
ncbi:hypothetical protein F7R01_08790 [Pseudomonas argentinensis]|uniref:Uncharacterized protein n=1 Tax=Phytopseudomonas argentinensis TaxID=289370 RepID=A0A1I3JCW1_9GAMM|nr:hypothetical protein [Pseudomonas argentinensis]KAB0551278.1 hypothetical protein F7R01_08790 [Pseudomonas argentinensis]SFI58102.1 hypothetical protein SAMN05216602_1767 [Pseudomonas argentinensis]